MHSKAFTLPIVMGALFASAASVNASDRNTHYQIFYDMCVATHGNVALAKKHAEAAGWKENKTVPRPLGSPVQVASWLIFKDQELYSAFLSTGPEAFLLDKKVHPDLVGIPFGMCVVSAPQRTDTAAVDGLKALLNAPGCITRVGPGAPKSTTFVHWPMRGPGYAVSYGFARFETKDSEGTYKKDVLGRTYAATDESQGKTFVRSACETKHPIIAPMLF